MDTSDLVRTPEGHIVRVIDRYAEGRLGYEGTEDHVIVAHPEMAHGVRVEHILIPLQASFASDVHSLGDLAYYISAEPCGDYLEEEVAPLDRR